MNFNNGYPNNDNKDNSNLVRPVSAFRFWNEESQRQTTTIIFIKMFTLESIIEAHYDCRHNKRRTVNATLFEVDFECELVRLCDELNARTYKPGKSIAFVVTRPQYREVFAATYRDRVVHHWICLRLIPLLEQHLSPRRFNCREGKGTLYGVERLAQDIYDVSEGYTKDCYVAKGDIQGFFMSINKRMLADLTERFIRTFYVGDDIEELVWAVRLTVLHSPEKDCVVKSPRSLWRHIAKNKSLFTNGEGLGVPIGNLPSQTLANLLLWVALDIQLERSGFVWGGYVDDFYVVDRDKARLLSVFPLIRERLAAYGLTLHPKKFYLQHYTKGVRFTGIVVRSRRRYVKRSAVYALEKAVRLLERCADGDLLHAVSVVNSYLGQMAHHSTYAIRRYVLQRADIYGHCYVGGRFGKVVIRKGYARRTTVPTLALASGVPQGADVEICYNRRSA